MKTILVPIDFSPCATHALEYACSIANKVKAKIVLLHVISAGNHIPKIASDGKWSGTWEDEAPAENVPLMMKLLKRVKKNMNILKALPFCSNIVITDVVETGEVTEKINASAKKHNADLIVMGTLGAKGLTDVLVGSNAERVVRDASIPVLSVPDGKEIAPFKTIVFATDFSEETKLVFPFVQLFADIFGAEIHFLKIISDSTSKARSKAHKEGEDFIQKNNYGTYPISIQYDTHSKAGAINRFARQEEADLIAVGTHGRHGLAHFFKGSIAEDVVNYSFAPVLTVNFQKNKNIQTTDKSSVKKKVKKESDLELQIPSL